MTAINLPFGASADRRAPTSPELSGGFACGDADIELFNWLMWWLSGQVSTAISKAGFTVDDTVLNRLAESMRSQALNYRVAGGTPNALTVEIDPAPPSLASMEGMPLRVRIAATNTAAAPILTVNGFPGPITRADGTEVQPGELAAGSIVDFIGAGTGWFISNVFAINMPPRVQTIFSASGSYVVPANTYMLFVRLVGAGGGAGGSNNIGSNVAQSAGGGGAGGYSEGWVSVKPGQTIPVTVGIGGVGGVLYWDGGNGGTSSFGSFLSATGGVGGKTLIGSPGGGTPGSGFGGSLNQYGGSGTDGHPNNNQYGGNGGASAFGGGGRSSIGSAGLPGLAPGSGGGGAYGPVMYPGGAGANGMVVIQR